MKTCQYCGYENENFQNYCLSCGGELPQEKKEKGILVGLICALLSFVCIAVVGGLLFYNSDSQIYTRAMEKAQRQYDMMNYEQALISYQTALQAMPEKEEIYICIHNTYRAMGNVEKAQQILEQGYERSESTRLFFLLQDFVSVKAFSDNVIDVTALSTENVELLSENVSLDPQMYQIFGKYTYGDYRRDYGEASSNVNEDGKMKLEWSSSGFALHYYETEENQDVWNSSQGVPHTYSMPTEISVSDISVLFRGFGGALSKTKLETLLGVPMTVSYNETKAVYSISFSYGNCYVTLQSDEYGNIVNKNGWNTIRPINYITEEEAEDEKNVETTGFVTDATTGLGIYGVSMKFTSNGSEVESIYTSGDGGYSVQLSAGRYEVEVSYGGYITTKEEFVIEEGSHSYFKNVILSPVLSEGSIRIVLEWGGIPRDLDSYTMGNFSDGSALNLNFSNTRCGIVNTAYYAELDVDDTNGYGPETSTIYDANANFTFYIEDYIGEGISDFSHVTVKVYIGGQGTPTIFTGSVKDFGIKRWTVFSYSAGQITTIDTYQ